MHVASLAFSVTNMLNPY